MDPNRLLTKLQESNILLHEVLDDANIVSDILEQAEVRVSDANAKYAALRRFVCAAITAELKRQVEEESVEGMLEDLAPIGKPLGQWDTFDHLMAHYADVSATIRDEDEGNASNKPIDESLDVEMSLQYPPGPSSIMSAASNPSESGVFHAVEGEGTSDMGEGPSSSRSRCRKGKEPERRSGRLKRASDDSKPTTTKKFKYSPAPFGA